MRRFECTQCGQCCRQPGYLVFEQSDIQTAAAACRVTAPEFIDRYLSIVEGEYVLEVPEGSACPFLLDNLCTIESGKPKQCRTYPFWPELIDNDAWAEEALRCEGIGRGPVLTDAQIRALTGD